ncbi:hypothetical protein D3C87_1833350 [compost metagenome]
MPFVLGQRKQVDEQHAGHGAGDQRAERMHQVRAGAHGHQPGQRAVVGEAGIVAASPPRRQRAAGHGHQRVDGHQAADLVHGLGAHHIEAEPAHRQHPGA